MRSLVLLPLSLLFLGLCSCGPAPIFEEVRELGPGGWAYADSLTFDVAITDTTGRQDLRLIVGHTPDFAYQNFYVRVTTRLPDGRVLSQPVSLQLADKYGNWYGNCSRGACTSRIAIQQNLRFRQPGTYRWTVSQFSREDPLPEITALGLGIAPLP